MESPLTRTAKANLALSRLDFNNTEIAFAGMSNYALRQAQFLFKIINNPLLAKLGPKMASLSLSLGLPVKGIIKASVFKHFCGGETIDECRRTIDRLWSSGIGTILDYSVEGKATESDFERCERELLNGIQLAKDNPALPFCVFKVTGLAPMDLLEKVSKGSSLESDETAAYARVHTRIMNLCSAAKKAKVRLLIDAEESWIQPAIDAFALEMMRLFNRDQALIYTTAQLYRTDRLKALQDWLQIGRENQFHIGVKVVRGAYMEKEVMRAQDNRIPSPIFPTKDATDQAFDEAVKLLLDHIDQAALCAGTHNENSTLRLTQLMEKKGLKRDDPRIHFAQLFGMSDHISFNLAYFGFNVAKYVPFGPVSEVLPYLSRRASENTSVQGQSSRELTLLMQEARRRGLLA